MSLPVWIHARRGRMIAVAAVIAAVAVIAAAGCGDNRVGGPEALRIDPAADTVAVGLEVVLTARYQTSTGELAAGPEVAWTSLDPAIATVTAVGDGTAIVTAVASGSVGIEARVDNLISAAAIFVEPAAVVDVTLEPATLTLVRSECVTVAAIGTISDGSRRQLTGTALRWSLAAGNVEGGFDGTVCGRQAGTDTLTARLGELRATTAIEVVLPAVTELQLFVEPQIMRGGEAFAFAQVVYADSETRDVTSEATWTSSAPEVAAVEPGIIRGLTVGTAVITVSAEGHTASLPLEVTRPFTIGLEVTPAAATVAVGGSRQLTATATFADGATGDVSADSAWLSGSPTVVAVAPGGRITGLQPGAAVVSATFRDDFGVWRRSVFVTVE